MELDQIKKLIDAMAASDLAEMEFNEHGWSLRLVRGHQPARRQSPRPSRQKPQAVEADATVRSPLYGIVWLRPQPDAPEFVSAGSAIKAGQTLCILEAMKVFHEVRATRDGTIASILVTAGSEVEAGQDLMRFG